MNTFTYSDIRLKIAKRIVPNYITVTKADIVKAIKEGISNDSIKRVMQTTYQVVTGTFVKDLLKDTNVNIDANDIQLKYVVSSEEVTI